MTLAIAIIFAMFAVAVFLIVRSGKQPKKLLRGNGGSESEAGAPQDRLTVLPFALAWKFVGAPGAPVPPPALRR